MTLQIMKKFKLPLLLLFVFLFSEAFSFDNIKKNKKNIINSIESHKDKLIEISDNIWEAAEPALLEFKSSKYLSDYAEENGFKVTKGVAEIPTAFVAEYGSGRPIIGIMGEFDANPGISQKKQPTKEPLVKGAAGHGCGHNLFGTASLGAAVAIKEQIEKGNLKGTVYFMGRLQKKQFLQRFGWLEKVSLINLMFVWIGIQETQPNQGLNLVRLLLTLEFHLMVVLLNR